MLRLMIAFPLTALLGCADFPALDATLRETARAAPYPTLIDIRPLIVSAAPASDTVDTQQARIAALTTRAALLRSRPVIAPALRAQMLGTL